MSEADSEPGRQPVHTRTRTAFVLVVTLAFGLQALTIVSGIITARLLGAEGRGIIALVFALGLFASQLTFGSLPNAIAKNLAQRRVAARDGLRSIARRRFAFVALPCLASGALMLVLQRSDLRGETYALAVAVAVMTLQGISSRILVGSLQGEVGHLGRMAVVGLVPQLLYATSLVVVWVADWPLTPLGAFGLYFAASFVGLGVGFFALARPTRRREDELDETALWSDTRKTYVSSVRPIDGLGLDRILVGTLLGNAPLGLYAAATTVSGLCSTVGGSIATIALPQVAARHEEPVAQRAIIRRWLMLSAVLIALVVTVLELVVSPAIRIAFGEEFVGAIPVARWLIIAEGLLGFRRVLIAVLQARGRGGTASMMELALTPVMVIAVVVAGLNENLTAIGIAMTVVGVLSCAALGVALRRDGRRRGDVSPVIPSSSSTMTTD